MFLKSPRRILILHGKPHSGKTTLIKNLFDYVSTLDLPYHLTGFLTLEQQNNGERTGFDLVYLRDRRITFPLAKRKDLAFAQGRPSVGKYVVYPENLEKIIEVIQSDLSKATLTPLLFIDEIGKMEVLSQKFIAFMEHLKEEHLVIATLGLGEHPFLRDWFSLKEALYVEVTSENRDFLRDRLKVEFHREGKLIVLEGIDGAGKTTLFRRLMEDISFSTFIFSQEPTHGSYGTQLRSALMKGNIPKEELLRLFILDREEHVKKLILPGLTKGKKILLDRYYLSTVAYQGVYMDDPFSLLKLNETFAPTPDFIFYLDVPVTIALKRVGHRDSGHSLFEKEDFLSKVYNIYEEILPLFPHVRLNALKSIEENFWLIKDTFKRLSLW